MSAIQHLQALRMLPALMMPCQHAAQFMAHDLQKPPRHGMLTSCEARQSEVLVTFPQHGATVTSQIAQAFQAPAARVAAGAMVEALYGFSSQA
jgi:hypothetical protein